MTNYYKPYFLFYGTVHFLAGLAFWIAPNLTRLFLNTTLAPEAAALMGFASALAGLGFIGAAYVTLPSHQKLMLNLSIVGNLLNLAVHAQNAVRGYSPPALIWIASISVVSMIAVLLLIRKAISK